MLALLLAALSPFAAAPAKAQITIWSATLTVDEDSGFLGCDNEEAAMDNCSSTSVLTEDEFTYLGVTYTVIKIYTYPGTPSSNRDLYVEFDVDNAPAGTWSLNVAGTSFSSDYASQPNEAAWAWANTGLSWTDNQQVSVSLTPPSPPDAVRFFSIGRGEDNLLQVGWYAPSGLVTGYDVHYTSASSSAVADDAAASGSDPAAGWVVWTDPIHTSTPGEPVGQRVITGLTNGTEYRVRVRARNSAGAGPWTVGKHTVGLRVLRLTPDPDILTSLTISDGTKDLLLQPNIANAVGLGGPGTFYAVHVHPDTKSLTFTPTWTNTNISGVTTEVRDMSGHTGVATSEGWGIAESGTAKSMPLPGHVTRINLAVFGTGGTPTYQIYVYHNRDWESVDARLNKLKMLTD